MGMLDIFKGIFTGQGTSLDRQMIENAELGQEVDALTKALPAYPGKPADPESYSVNPVDISNTYMMDAGGAAVETKRGFDPDQLRAMANIPLIAAIINTRITQVAEFAAPNPSGNSIGFQIRLRHPHKTPTTAQQETIRDIYEFMQTCGDPRLDNEMNFEAFLRMIVRDSLTFDAACFEVVRTRGGQVCGFTPVDAATIRRSKLTESEKANGRRDPEGVRFVQVVNDKVVAEFTAKQLCYGIRRPRTDILFKGYGHPELELCVGLLTSLLNAEVYNSANFTNGISASGIVAVKTSMNPQLFRAFRREFYQMLSGSSNAKKTPLIQLSPDGDEDVKAINLSNTNAEMEFQEWVHHLMKQICAIWCVDPSEVGFEFGQTGVRSTLNEGSPLDKVVMSKERGLRPLLRAIEYWLNTYVIRELDPDMELVFTGLDSMSPAEKLKMDVEKVKSIMTVNEVRALYDMKPIEGGDIILDQNFLNAGAAPSPASPITASDEGEA